MKPTVILMDGRVLRPDNATLLPNGAVGLEVSGVVVAVVGANAWSRIVLDPLQFAKISAGPTGGGTIDLSA